jgi:fibrillarin-like rRNA methylase
MGYTMFGFEHGLFPSKRGEVDIMAKLVEIPLTAKNGTIIGKLQIDKDGRFKIQTKQWISPGDFDHVTILLRGLTTDMKNLKFSKKIGDPVRWGRGHI